MTQSILKDWVYSSARKISHERLQVTSDQSSPAQFISCLVLPFSLFDTFAPAVDSYSMQYSPSMFCLSSRMERTKSCPPILPSADTLTGLAFS